MKSKFFKATLIFLLFVLIDQISKYLIRSRGGFYICNINISWGIPVPSYFFWIFTGLFFFFLFFCLKREYLNQNILYLTPLFAGALGNIIDRILSGCVIDFIDLKFWPMFNFADVFIVLGVMILLVRTFRI